MKPIILHPDAEQELDESVNYYKEHGGKKLALGFEARVRAMLKLVGKNPERFPRVTRYRIVQKCHVTRFPFSIYYIDRPADIWVIAFSHGRRRPMYWGNRLQ